MDKKELGIVRIKEILGDRAQGIIENFQKTSPDFANYIVEFAYGDLYTREGINDKTREIVAVSCLIGQGNTGLPLRAHLQGMLNVGWTKDEIIEVIIFSAGYCGFPPAVDALLTFQQLLEQ